MEYVLLGLLAEQPQHGYDLHKSMLRLEGVGLIWRVQQAALYAALDRLEGLGLVQASKSPDQHPTRKELSLTKAGHAAFSEWKAALVKHPRLMRQEFLARLYFTSREGKSSTRQLVLAQVDACEEWLTGLKQQLNALPEVYSYEGWVLKFRIGNILAMINWLRDIAESLE